MHARHRTCPTAPAWTAGLLALVLLAPAVPASDGLVGAWRLVEQTYDGGEQNLARSVEAHGLSVAVGPGGPVVRTWTGDDPDALASWPAAFEGDRRLVVDVLERTVDPRSGRLTARYRVPPAVEGGLTLELEETYLLDRERDELVGTVTVRMSRDGEPRGGYTLTRRYARTR